MKDVNQKQCSYVVLLMLLGIVLPLESQAQKSIEVGVLGGVAYYNGDINPGKPFVQPKAAYGFLARYNLDNRWALKLSYTYGNIAGSDSISKAVANRNFSFSTSLNELAVTGEFNFWQYSIGSKLHFFTPYIMGGGSFFLYSHKLFNGSVHQNPNKKYSFALIFGYGFKYSLTKKLGLAIEWGMRKTFTNDLDDISTNYTKDWYNFTVVSITYKINFANGQNCRKLKW